MIIYFDYRIIMIVVCQTLRTQIRPKLGSFGSNLSRSLKVIESDTV